MPSHCAGSGRQIRTAATAAPTAPSVTRSAAAAMCRLVIAAIAPLNTAAARAAMNNCAAPSPPGAATPLPTASAGIASHPNPSNRSR